MHKSIEEVFKDVESWTQEDITDYLNKIDELLHNDFLKITQLKHLIDNHNLLSVYAPFYVYLSSGWSTDFVIAGFEQETKESLLKLTLASFNNYINSLDVSLAKNKSEQISTYIFMVAYLNTIRNGEFNYNVFFRDIEFLSNKVLDKFKVEDEAFKKLYKPISIICNALPSSVDFITRYEIDNGKIKNVNKEELRYKDINGNEIISVSTKLMEKFFQLKYLTVDNIGDSRKKLQLKLKENPKVLEEILSYVFCEAFAIENSQRTIRKDVDTKIEAEHDTLPKLQEEPTQEPKPNTFVRFKKAIQAFISSVIR